MISCSFTNKYIYIHTDCAVRNRYIKAIKSTKAMTHYLLTAS